MPHVTRLPPKKQVLAGIMRIVPEGTNGAWPGDNPNQCALGYNCPPPTVTLDNYDTFGNRYIDIGSGGPSTFTYTITSNASWVQFSQTKGTVSPSAPESRVFLSVNDWSKVNGTQTAALTFTALTAGQPPLAVSALFTVTKNVLPQTFKGFVEGSQVISMEAQDFTSNTTVDGTYWTVIPDYGRTVSGVTPWPRADGNYSAGAGPSVEYDFYNFNTQGESGNLTITTQVTPTMNNGEADRPVAFAVQLDSQAIQTFYFYPSATPGGYPAAWGGDDGFVANMIVSVPALFTGVTPGAHKLKIFMVEPTVVLQKIIIDCGGLVPSYLGPPESIRV
ncbi:hypothetical protein C0991_001869 [Blastosporella zonata]|nr:hypothetical protein C0991_001869 [Blastosporella zonata]